MILSGLRHYLLAVQFFTRLPITGRLATWVGFSEPALRRSAAHFPGVGWLVGAVAALTWWATATLLGGGAAVASPALSAVAAVLSTAATVVLTGAFHEDGLADVADGLGGSLDREPALVIMKDSRLGTFGVLALILALGAKSALLVALSVRGIGDVLIILLVAHVLSRLMPLALIRGLDYVEANANDALVKAKPLADAISGRALIVGIAWTLPAWLMLGVVVGPVAVIASAVALAGATGVLARWFRRRLGGFTGDCLGATQQLIELLIYLCVCAVPLTSVLNPLSQ